jgi:hypothetical protein
MSEQGGLLYTVTIASVIFSGRAQTASIIRAIGNSTGTAIGAAVAPVTGDRNAFP